MDVRPVESWQVVIVEAWALTHQHVPWLKRLGSSLVLDDRIDALMDFHHSFDVRVLLPADFILMRHRGLLGLLLLSQLRLHPCAGAPSGLPSVGKSSRPVGIGRPVVADVD